MDTEHIEGIINTQCLLETVYAPQAYSTAYQTHNDFGGQLHPDVVLCE